MTELKTPAFVAKVANDRGPVLDSQAKALLQTRTTIRLPSAELPLFHARRG